MVVFTSYGKCSTVHSCDSCSSALIIITGNHQSSRIISVVMVKDCKFLDFYLFHYSISDIFLYYNLGTKSHPIKF